MAKGVFVGLYPLANRSAARFRLRLVRIRLATRSRPSGTVEDREIPGMLDNRVKRIAKSMLDRFDLSVVQRQTFREMSEKAVICDRLPILTLLSDEELRKGIDLVAKSPSQLGQDIMALKHSKWKKGGFYVEFGATNGRSLSNSWLLEKEFGWAGILAEPGRLWKHALASSGRNAALEFDCVWDKSGELLTFSELGELSTVTALADRDFHAASRERAKSYKVNTISFNDLLQKYDAPANIDFLSIDTEGSELKILRSINFSKYRIGMIACEHNYSDDRANIHDLLSRHGYVRKFEEISLFDDWYFSDQTG